MAINLHQLFLMAADLTLASVLSFVLYAFACLCIASLFSFVIFLSSFGVAKKVKRKMGQKGRSIMVLTSKSTVGGMLVKKLDKAGFGGLAVCHSPEGELAPMLEKECTSNTRVTELPVAEEKNQAVMQTLIKSQGMSGVMKKPSVIIWEEETERPKASKRKVSPEQKNGFLTPAFFIALIWAAVNIVCPCLKKRSYGWQVCVQVWEKLQESLQNCCM
ncbi:uncharacterized protein LOC133384259 isoform X2 [Rhineura floridana]|uniref:uncharacterized protein LOC133384259 isoform X2 n=1 Tax=Rhineura floridana TaxID=261503 RepID=UPI002AC83C51|nr:uncharacterized protein LOC133384259 isoform X2 [Rhineura floridana]